MGSLDITVLGDAQGGVNASDVRIFMKNMGVDQYVALVSLFGVCFVF